VQHERLLSFEDSYIKQRWPFSSVVGGRAENFSLIIETSGDNYRCEGQSQQEVQFLASLCNHISKRQARRTVHAGMCA
jgi:hypothetical protein